ncbi:MAG: hypothetical protein ACRDSL_19360 [Pseudonocardiaceae bacterium]
MLPPGTPMPAHGGWAAAADLLLVDGPPGGTASKARYPGAHSAPP